MSQSCAGPGAQRCRGPVSLPEHPAWGCCRNWPVQGAQLVLNPGVWLWALSFTCRGRAEWARSWASELVDVHQMGGRRKGIAQLQLPGTAWLAGLRSSPLTGEGAGSETEALRGLGPWRACPLSQLILRAFPAIPGPQQAFQKLRHVRTFMSHSNLTQNSSFLPWN